MNGIFAGVITEETVQGYTFVYERENFANPVMPAISLTLPKTRQTYKSQILFPFLNEDP